MKIVTIVGARPQFIKAAVVSRVIVQRPHLHEVIVHTGQHYDENMSEVFFREMRIPPPQHRLDIHGMAHGAMTGQMLEAIEGILEQEKPDCVLVYGDTDTTLAAALAAVKLQRDVAHVEAGLRSFNMRMPEEVNRVLTDRILRLLLCPTEAAVQNLQNEGFGRRGCAIVRTGDVMQDAALFYAEESAACSAIVKNLRLGENAFALCTIHRAENTDEEGRLRSLFAALDLIQEDMDVIVPLHPRTRAAMHRHSISTRAMCIDPVGYFDMVELLRHCRLVMTDSGGLQKEAFFFGKPCVTLRDETEWVELVAHGCNMVAGTETASVVNAFHAMSDVRPDTRLDLYGRGTAGVRVVDALERIRDA